VAFCRTSRARSPKGRDCTEKCTAAVFELVPAPRNGQAHLASGAGGQGAGTWQRPAWGGGVQGFSQAPNALHTYPFSTFLGLFWVAASGGLWLREPASGLLIILWPLQAEFTRITSLLASKSPTWHNVGMGKKGHRLFSCPPYMLLPFGGDLPLCRMSGKTWQIISRLYGREVGEPRLTLLELRRRLLWSRSTLGAFLGVGKDTLRRWETGERYPSGAARRLIWLIDVLVFHPERLVDGMDFMLWGRRQQILQFGEILRKLLGVEDEREVKAEDADLGNSPQPRLGAFEAAATPSQPAPANGAG